MPACVSSNQSFSTIVILWTKVIFCPHNSGIYLAPFLNSSNQGATDKECYQKMTIINFIVVQSYRQKVSSRKSCKTAFNPEYIIRTKPNFATTGTRPQRSSNSLDSNTAVMERAYTDCSQLLRASQQFSLCCLADKLGNFQGSYHLYGWASSRLKCLGQAMKEIKHVAQ